MKKYYPFGWEMPGRQLNTGNYRHGFNGKENDRHWAGQLIQDYGFRLYNPAIGKFLSVDPLFKGYPFFTPYQFAGNKPIWAIDLDGLESAYTNYLNKLYGSKEHLEKTTANRVKDNQAAVDMMGEGLTWTDVNDAAILSSTMVGNPTQINGKPASGWDIGFAAAGVLVPFIAGGVIKKFFWDPSQLKKANEAGRHADEVSGYWQKEMDNPAFNTINPTKDISNCTICTQIDLERQILGSSTLDHAPALPYGGKGEEVLQANLQKILGTKSKFNATKIYQDKLEKTILQKYKEGAMFAIAQDRGLGKINHVMSSEIRHGQLWVRDGQNSTIQLFSDYIKKETSSNYKYMYAGQKKTK